MNRGRIEIFAHILAFCVQPRLKTQIMYKASITFRQFDVYLALLSSHGLLVREGNRYAATERGRRFVQAFGQLQTTLGEARIGFASNESTDRIG